MRFFAVKLPCLALPMAILLTLITGCSPKENVNIRVITPSRQELAPTLLFPDSHPDSVPAISYKRVNDTTFTIKTYATEPTLSVLRVDPFLHEPILLLQQNSRITITLQNGSAPPIIEGQAESQALQQLIDNTHAARDSARTLASGYKDTLSDSLRIEISHAIESIYARLQQQISHFISRYPLSKTVLVALQLKKHTGASLLSINDYSAIYAYIDSVQRGIYSHSLLLEKLQMANALHRRQETLTSKADSYRAKSQSAPECLYALSVNHSDSLIAERGIPTLLIFSRKDAFQRLAPHPTAAVIATKYPEVNGQILNFQLAEHQLVTLFFKKNGQKLLGVASLPGKSVAPLLDSLGIELLPTTLLYDRRGTLIATNPSFDYLEKAIQQWKIPVPRPTPVRTVDTTRRKPQALEPLPTIMPSAPSLIPTPIIKEGGGNGS